MPSVASLPQYPRRHIATHPDTRGNAQPWPNPPVSETPKDGNDDHGLIMAERFKTRMCRNYERTGMCPYMHRCMFAHGMHEMRSVDMNLKDGLTDEDAIFDFKKVNFMQRLRVARALHRQMYGRPLRHNEMIDIPPLLPVVPFPLTPAGAAVRISPGSRSPASSYPTPGDSFRPSLSGSMEQSFECRTPSNSASSTHTNSPPLRSYRHDPYAEFSKWHPLRRPSPLRL